MGICPATSSGTASPGTFGQRGERRRTSARPLPTGTGSAVEPLWEIQAPADAEGPASCVTSWAERLPSEQAWVVRKR